MLGRLGVPLGIALTLWGAAGARADDPTDPEVEAELAVGADEADGVIWIEDGHTGELIAMSVEDLDPGPEPEATDTPEPRRWAPSRGADCHRYRGRRVCEGPRRVPLPHGSAAARAVALGIGHHGTATRLLTAAPLPRWVAAVGGRRAALTWPVAGGRLSRGFGLVPRGRRGHRLHKGLDIGAPEGTRVLAAARGLVVYADNEVSGYGNLVIVLHADGTTTWYAHLRAAWVFPGMSVEAGQTIGEVGETGIAHGPHLHFEWRLDGEARDPLPGMRGRPEPDG